MQLIDVQDRLQGKTVLLVSAGRTTIDYSELASKYDTVFLLNRALKLCELFVNHTQQVFFVSVHPEIFGSDPLITLPHVTTCFPAFGKVYCPPEVVESGIWFDVEDAHVYDPESFRASVNDVQQTLELNRLCAICNSAHVTLHLIYTLGCRELHVVGAHEYRGVAVDGYDPRLWNEPSDTCAEGYIKAFRDWVGLFEWNVTYLGD